MTDTMTAIEKSAAGVRMEMSDGIALLRLDEPDKSVNTLSAPVIEAMRTILDRLESGEARAAVLLSDKPGVWIAGADIEQFTQFTSAADGERATREGHKLLNRLENLPIPVVAAIDGVALGGGVETALACTYRIAADTEKTRLGLPEVQLGLLPGAGGSQRLPRLVGIRAALDLMLTGKRLDPRRAKKIGLVDEVVPGADLESIAIRIAGELADGKREPRRGNRRGSPLALERLPGVKSFIIRKAREGVMAKTRGLYPAPLRILEVVDRGLDLPVEEALELEPPAFGELSVTPEARSLVHLFFATTGAKSDAGVEGDGKALARDVERLAIVGAGFMGAGIATASAEKGMRVRLKDITPENAAKGLRTAHESLVKRARRRKRPSHEIEALKGRVTATHEYTGFRRTELVVEAVFEDVELKHRVIREVEEAASEETVLGTNTSTIPIATLAEASSRPGNVIGLHFFSPVEKMPLLEIIVTPQTEDWVTATAHAYGKRIGKTPIVVNDAPGFYANRILTPYMAEALLLLEEGVRMEELDRAMKNWGFPVGPITLYDEVGLDVAHKAAAVMREAFGDRMEESSVLDRMVEDDRMGRKNGRGFFTYEDGKKGKPDESVYGLIGDPEPKEVPEADVQERLGLTMVNEAVRCLEDDVLRNPRDGDVGAVLGIGFPPFRGGPFWYVDRTGAEQVVARLRALESRFGRRFSPSARLVEMAEKGETFFEG